VVTRLINLIDSDVGRSIGRILANLDVEYLSEKAADSIAADLNEGYKAVSIKRKQASLSIMPTSLQLKRERGFEKPGIGASSTESCSPPSMKKSTKPQSCYEAISNLLEIKIIISQLINDD